MAMNREEEKVRDFYDHYGWVTRDGVSGEDALFRQFSRPYYSYHDGVAARTIDSFADLDGQLLLAGGGDLPETHVTVARKFSHTTCLDISKVGIEIARNKGEFIVGSILEIPKPDASFDAVYCAHVIYHIEKDQQQKAVRELVRVTKPGGRIVVIYSNPDSLPRRIAAIKGKLPILWKLHRKPTRRSDAGAQPPPYFFAHPLSWWAQFDDECELHMKPWDVMGNLEEETLLINDTVASVGYRISAWFESRYPDKATQWWSFPLILLTKKSETRSSTS
jgi:SAM-dependent methyltransferase